MRPHRIRFEAEGQIDADLVADFQIGEAGVHAIEESPDCDAIIAQHAGHVSSLYRICADLGRSIPRDVGVICRQDPGILLDFSPEVSGFRLPEFALGDQAVEQLNRIIVEGNPLPEMQMRYEFTPRASL